MSTSKISDHAISLIEMGANSDAGILNPWAEKIGQLILNFGGVEFLTHKYLVLLEKSESDFDASLQRPLQARIDRIQLLLQEVIHLPQAARELAIRDWAELRKMCLWRNHIAHNPVLPYWGRDKNPETEPPEGITMPDLRQLKSGGGVHLSLELLSHLVEISANLSRRLVETANSFPMRQDF